LAALLSRSRLEALLDETLLTGKVRLDDFEEPYERILGTRLAGSARLRTLIDERAGVTSGVDSTYLERLLERVLSDPRIPPALREHPMTIDGERKRLDAFIEDWGLVVEADSRRWHARQADFEADRARDNALIAMGLVVVRLTYRMLKDDPAGCAETVIAAGVNRRASRPG
jgi:very-short-patch-repair endonuclease